MGVSRTSGGQMRWYVNGNGNKFRLTTLHNNSGKQTTSPARHKMGKHIEYIKYEEEGGENSAEGDIWEG